MCEHNDAWEIKRTPHHGSFLTRALPSSLSCIITSVLQTVLDTSFSINVLAFLYQRAGRAQTRGQIAEHALSEHGDCSDRTVDSHISRIRKKLGPDTGGLIKTIWGIGYRCDVVQS